LKRIENIVQMDAVLAHAPDGTPIEPEWPTVDVIIGNPPFLGGSKLRGELGNEYTDALFALYSNRLPVSDLVCYWFEKARAMIEVGKVKRVGLLATQAIRGGANRKVLERIKETGDIFWAYADRNWILNGATVHVAMIGFDNGTEKSRILDGSPVSVINSDLTTSGDLTQSVRLSENLRISFRGTQKGGSFDINEPIAKKFLSDIGNPNGKSNAYVVKPWLNGQAIVGSVGKNTWIIDFGDMDLGEASKYHAPFEYVKKNVLPAREKNNRARRRNYWWQHSEVAPGFRDAISGLSRYIATPRVSKYRIFIWVKPNTIPDDGVYIFARDDDYFFGVLHSKLHELWARATGTQLREAESGFRYTTTSTFETFPFPWAPGKEPADDPRVLAIASAAKELVEMRERWLNVTVISEMTVTLDAGQKKRTRTNLYNERPTWLDLAHKKLDAAVLSAYGWPEGLSDDEILVRLLKLNLERAGK
jgi:type II restriction/modification system DNA methylase subunit YeeA